MDPADGQRMSREYDRNERKVKGSELDLIGREELRASTKAAIKA